ncbi:MAG: ribonuclease P protein component 1 [Candidatus Hodarchaeota archaeon]
MKITPKNIIQHELIGLKVFIIKATDKGYEGLKGIIIDETRNMFIIRSNSDKVYKIPKKVCVFRFDLPDNLMVEVKGSLLVGKPENRLKKRVRTY